MDKICEIIDISKKAYLEENRPYANEHA